MAILGCQHFSKLKPYPRIAILRWFRIIQDHNIINKFSLLLYVRLHIDSKSIQARNCMSFSMDSAFNEARHKEMRSQPPENVHSTTDPPFLLRGVHSHNIS